MRRIARSRLVRAFLGSWYVRAFIETPAEILLAIVSVFSGAVIIAFHLMTPAVPDLLQWIAASAITAGGAAELVARFCPRDCARLERAAVAPLVATYLAYPTWALVRLGVSWVSVQSVIALYAIAVIFAMRAWKVGVTLRAVKQVNRPMR